MAKDRKNNPEYKNGFNEGLTTALNEVSRIKNSFGDVWVVYSSGLRTPEKQKVSEQMSLIVDALESLEEMISENFLYNEEDSE